VGVDQMDPVAPMNRCRRRGLCGVVQDSDGIHENRIVSLRMANTSRLAEGEPRACGGRQTLRSSGGLVFTRRVGFLLV
jgi:hypothetical protein